VTGPKYQNLRTTSAGTTVSEDEKVRKPVVGGLINFPIINNQLLIING